MRCVTQDGWKRSDDDNCVIFAIAFSEFSRIFTNYYCNSYIKRKNLSSSKEEIRSNRSCFIAKCLSNAAHKLLNVKVNAEVECYFSGDFIDEDVKLDVHSDDFYEFIIQDTVKNEEN